MDGRVVLITPGGDEMLTLNGTGSILWAAMTESTTATHLADRVHDELDVDRDVLDADVVAFLDELTAASVVVLES